MAFVTVTGGRVDVTLDGNIFGARVNCLIYNVQTSVVAQIHNVLTGRLVFELTQGDGVIQGAIELGGSSGSGGPSVNSVYAATFTGVRAG